MDIACVRRVIIGLLLALSSSSWIAAIAAEYPSRAVRIVVPFTTGGAQDAVARTFNVELGAALGHPFVVENRPGAGGVVGTLGVARAAPDGYTLLLAGASHQINGFLYAKAPYRPLEDFTAVSYIGSINYVLAVPVSVPVQSVGDLIAYAKGQPGKLDYVSAGVGSAVHLAMAYFISLAGVDMLHVPLKGGGDVLLELMAARAQAAVVPINVALPYAKDQRVRMLATTGASRSRFLPDLPTLDEAGVHGYRFESWLGLLGPAGLPEHVVGRIDSQTAKLLGSDVVAERLVRQGVERASMSSAQFAEKLRSEDPMWADIVRRSGARLN